MKQPSGCPRKEMTSNRTLWWSCRIKLCVQAPPRTDANWREGREGLQLDKRQCTLSSEKCSCSVPLPSFAWSCAMNRREHSCDTPLSPPQSSRHSVFSSNQDEASAPLQNTLSLSPPSVAIDGVSTPVPPRLSPSSASSRANFASR
jgi:hypothetical protein